MQMLRVSHIDNATGQRWSLCGHLAGPWVDELRASWSHARKSAPRARAVVDLTDVMFIDEEGERLLAEMESAGAEFVAAGVENKHLLSSLKQKGKRPLRRSMEHLGSPCSKSAEAMEESSENDSES
jgi:hypothetical protein